MTPRRRSASLSAAASSPTSTKRKLPAAGPSGLEAPLAEHRLERRHRLAVHGTASRELRRRVEARERRLLRRRRRRRRRAAPCGSPLSTARADPIADAQPRETVDLRERPQREDAPAALRGLLDRVREVTGPRRTRSTPRRRRSARASGTARESASMSSRVGHRPGRVVDRRQERELRPRGHGGEQRVDVDAAVDERRPHRDGRELQRIEHIARERRPRGDDLVAGSSVAWHANPITASAPAATTISSNATP